MRNRLITALTFLTGILLICSFALGEDVILTVGGQTFTCAADATQIDLGDVTVPDTDEDYAALRAFLDSVFSNTLPVSLSVKTRIGFERAEEWPGILAVLADYPFDHVTVHPRTTRDQYTGPVHPEAFDLAVRKGIPHPVWNGDLRTPEDVRELTARCPAADAVMIGRGLLADPALARRIRGGPEAGREELEAWYTVLYEGWKDRFGTTIALGRIKKLMEYPAGDDVRRKRLLRRAEEIGSCIRAVTGE